MAPSDDAPAGGPRNRDGSARHRTPEPAQQPVPDPQRDDADEPGAGGTTPPDDDPGADLARDRPPAEPNEPA